MLTVQSCLHAEMLSLIPGKELGGATLQLWVLTAPITACKTNTKCYFHLLPFFMKAKILFRFLLVSKIKYQYRFFIKVKWHKANSQKAGDACIVLFCELPFHISWMFSFGFPALSFWFAEAKCSVYIDINYLWILDFEITFSQLLSIHFSHIL